METKDKKVIVRFVDDGDIIIFSADDNFDNLQRRIIIRNPEIEIIDDEFESPGELPEPFIWFRDHCVEEA